MAMEIATKTAAHALTRKEKRANKDTVQKKASAHEDKAIAALAGLLGDRKAPATAKARAADILLDRIAGKAAKPEDEKQSEQSQLEKMSAPELVQYITEQMSGLPAPVRAILAQSADTGLALHAADLVEKIEKVEPAAPQGLPPLANDPRRQQALAEAQQRKTGKNEMKKTQDTVIDPNERVVKPRNASTSRKDGGGTMRHVERSLAEHAMDVEGGGKVKDRR